MFCVMYFSYITQNSKLDFSQRNMVKIWKWVFNLLQSEYNPSSFTDPYIKWLSKKNGMFILPCREIAQEIAAE